MAMVRSEEGERCAREAVGWRRRVRGQARVRGWRLVTRFGRGGRAREERKTTSADEAVLSAITI
jgi:hypothetical protein